MNEPQYVRATTIDEAITELTNASGDGLIVAGGTVVCTLFNQHLASPKVLVDISRIPNLSDVGVADNGSILIGALVTHDQILRSSTIIEKVPLLNEIAGGTSCARLRNRGTIGGNLCTIGSQGDAATGLIALGAMLHLLGPTGARVIPLERFYADEFTIDLKADEILEKIELPPIEQNLKYGFCKLGPRKAMDWTQITVSVVFDGSGKAMKDIRIGMNGVSNAPSRPLKIERWLEGNEADKIDWDALAIVLSEEVAPESDLVYSAQFKKRLAGVALRRALEHAIKKPNTDIKGE